MKYLYVAAALLLGSPAFAEVKTYDLVGFNKVVAEGKVSVVIVTDAEFDIHAEALKGNLDRLFISQSGDTVSIKYDEPWGVSKYFTNDRLLVSIVIPELVQIDALDEAFVRVENTTSLRSARADDGAFLRIFDAELSEITAIAERGSRLSIKGTCNELNATSHSGSFFRAIDFKCLTGEISAADISQLSAQILETVTIEAASSSAILLDGSPVILGSDLSIGSSLEQIDRSSAN